VDFYSMIYVDIETAPNAKMAQFVEPAKVLSIADAPRNYTKTKTLVSWVEKAQEKEDAAYQDRLASMSLDVDFSRICALAFALDDEDVDVWATPTPDIERDVLREFWGAVAHSRRVCGFNALGFDLPIIVRRSWVLGVKPTRTIDMRRYSTSSVVDIMQIMYQWGQSPGVRYRGLKMLAKMYGVKNPLPELDGSQVGEMDEETLCNYCANDVRMVRELAARTQHFYWV